MESIPHPDGGRTAVIAVLVALVSWSRRGQSSIRRESGDTVHQTRRQAQSKNLPPPGF